MAAPSARGCADNGLISAARKARRRARAGRGLPRPEPGGGRRRAAARSAAALIYTYGQIRQYWRFRHLSGFDPLLRRCRTVVRYSLLPGEIARRCLIAGHVVQRRWRRLWVSQTASVLSLGYEPHDAGLRRLACSLTCHLAGAVVLLASLGVELRLWRSAPSRRVSCTNACTRSSRRQVISSARHPAERRELRPVTQAPVGGPAASAAS